MAESVDLLIDGDRFAHWDDIELVNSIDRFSTLSFSAPFQPERAEFRQRFRPFSFQPIRVYLDGDALYKGTLVGVDPEFDASSARVGVTGYALPGVLDDCNGPARTIPHEYKKVDLRTIAQALANPFGLSLRFDVDPGKKFIKAKLTQEKKIFEFLIELAQQRGLVISNDAEGAVLFWKSVETGSPVAIFVEGEQPITKARASFSPQEVFSEITGYGHSKRGHRGKHHTELNPWLRTILRPRNYQVPDADPADVEDATRAELGRMFANMATWQLEDLPGWRDPNGDLWQPNKTLMLTAPHGMIYRRTELLIRSVTLKQKADSETTSLELCMPGAFSGKVPDFMPWDEPIAAGI